MRPSTRVTLAILGITLTLIVIAAILVSLVTPSPAPGGDGGAGAGGTSGDARQGSPATISQVHQAVTAVAAQAVAAVPPAPPAPPAPPPPASEPEPGRADPLRLVFPSTAAVMAFGQLQDTPILALAGRKILGMWEGRIVQRDLPTGLTADGVQSWPVSGSPWSSHGITSLGIIIPASLSARTGLVRITASGHIQE